MSLLRIKSSTVDLAVEVVIDYSGPRVYSSAWLVALPSKVALPTTIVTSPCKNDSRVERVSWSVFNWKYIGDCIYLRRLLLGSLGRLRGEGVLGLRPRLLSLGCGGGGGGGGGGSGGGDGGGGGGGGASAGSGAGACAAGSGAGSSAGGGASAGGLPGSSSYGGGLSANNNWRWSSSSISMSLSMAMSGK